MFINELEFQQHYLEYSGLIVSMSEKLIQAKLKNPKADYSDAERKIELLEGLQSLFYKMYYNQIAIDNHNFRITKKFHIMDDKIKKLEEEIIQLKRQLNF